MERDCDTCGTTYTAKTQRSRYCSHVCRTKASKAGRAKPKPKPKPKPARVAALPVPQAAPSAAVVEATVRELTEAGRLHTASGQRALALAHLIDSPPEGAWSSVAGWCREHEAAMGRALDGVQRVERAPDVLDEVKARRDRIRGA